MSTVIILSLQKQLQCNSKTMHLFDSLNHLTGVKDITSLKKQSAPELPIKPPAPASTLSCALKISYSERRKSKQFTFVASHAACHDYIHTIIREKQSDSSGSLRHIFSFLERSQIYWLIFHSFPTLALSAVHIGQ